jgi:hypothetical protein
MEKENFLDISFNKNGITTSLSAVPVDVSSDFYETAITV